MLAIDTLSRAEKLKLMEALWADLSCDPAAVDMPAWHEHALAAAQQEYARGEANFLDWDQAKAQLRRRR